MSADGPVRVDHVPRDERVDGGAVFLDRDGVIVRNRPDYLRRPEDIEFLPGAVPALRRLTAAGRTLVIVTNQAVVGKRLITLTQAVEIHRHITDVLTQHGVRLAASYLCPHVDTDCCPCRKPAPGMLVAAFRDRGIDAASSTMIGDALTDVEAGRRARTDTMLVLTGRGRDEAPRHRGAGKIVADLPGAVSSLLDAEERRR